MTGFAESPEETDVLGAPYTARTVQLGADNEGDVVATLVHRPAGGIPRGAVLHVHGFADYFFQTPAADFWVESGYDFYALDLRKYGRSLRDHQTPTYVADLATYYEELDHAFAFIRARHERLVVSGHSTGGLTVSLWVEDRRPDVAGVLLNSPWLDLQGPAWTRGVGTAMIDRVGAAQPMRVVPRPTNGVYTKTLSRDFDGEFEVNLTWKPPESFPVRFGWLRAVRRGHERVHQGLSIEAPILVLRSSRSSHAAHVNELAHTSDVVLDVEQIKRWSSSLGRHVTSIAIPHAKHEITLSLPHVRAAAFAEITTWLEAYVHPTP